MVYADMQLLDAA